MDEVTVKAPATVSNVVCGYDCLGFALSEPYDTITVRRIDEPIVRITHQDDFNLPTEPGLNVAGVALRAMMAAGDLKFGFEVDITKGIKPGSGIGSSAASSCGAVVAANKLIGERFSKTELVGFALEGERLASGARHADNVAPCILGGFTLVRSTQPLDIVDLDFPTLFATVLHPQIEIKTSDARAILPAHVELNTAVRQWANLGAFVSALARADHALLARSMVDHIVEPARRSFIPMFDEAIEASRNAGAIGGGISGSGPSIFMLSGSLQTASNIAGEIESIYSHTGVPFRIYACAIDRTGVTTL